MPDYTDAFCRKVYDEYVFLGVGFLAEASAKQSRGQGRQRSAG